MRKIEKYFSCIIFISLIMQGAVWSSEAFIKIGTGGPTGVYFQVGNAICKMVAKIQSAEHGRRKGTEKTYYCSAPSTGGSTYNIGQIMQGELQFGVAQSDWQYHAYNGTKPDKVKPFKGLRSVFSAHPEPAQLFARKGSKIKDFYSLKNKIVNIGNPGSGQRGMMEILLKAHGMSTSDFKKTYELSSYESFQTLCDKKIDAFLYLVGFPNSAVENIHRCGGYMVPLDTDPIKRLVENNSFLAMTTIPKGTYTKQKKNVKTFGVKSTVVTNKDVSNETVYDIVKAVFENLDDFKRQHPAFFYLNKKMMLEGLSAPLHAGAIKFYKESAISYPNHLYIGYAEKSERKEKKVKKVAKVVEQEQEEIKVKIKKKDTTGPVIEIAEAITVDDSSYTLKGKVSDKGSDKIYLKIDGEDIPIKRGKFKTERYSPVDEEIKIVAIDKFGNKSTKIVKVTVNIKGETVVQKLEPLNPSRAKGKTSGEKVALIIGIENYSEAPKANYANLDAKYFFDYARKGFGVKKKNINLLIDEDANLAKTNSAIFKWLPSKIKKNQTDLIIFFSGHGLASDDGKQKFILPYNADPDLLSRTALSRKELFDEIVKLKPKSVTMFFDTCYSGVTRDEEMLLALAKPLRIVADDENKIPENFTIFTASKPDQISSGLKEAKHGIFSYYLMKGLEGKADSNKDKQITNGELLAYMDQNVSEKALDLGRQQNPSLTGNPDQVLIKY